MRGEELVGFLHRDLSGLNRVRSVLASGLESRLEAGVGWVPADQALAVLVLGGLRGIEGDPSELEEERRRLGIRPLPDSLEGALGALESDAVVRSWFSKDLPDCYLSLKRTEISLLVGADPKEACERYLSVY